MSNRNQEPVSSNNRQPVLSDNQEPVSGNNQQPVLSDNQIEHFRAFGFVALPGLLGAGRAEALGAEVDAAH